VFDYIERFYNPKTLALEDRISEPYGVREQGGISLTGCHPNRMQARARAFQLDASEDLKPPIRQNPPTLTMQSATNQAWQAS
jgi:hypothetical protein